MLSKEEIEALSSCVGSAIGEFGASETTDLAIEAIRKLESGLTPLALDGARVAPHCEHGYNGSCHECSAVQTPPRQ